DSTGEIGSRNQHAGFGIIEFDTCHRKIVSHPILFCYSSLPIKSAMLSLSRIRDTTRSPRFLPKLFRSTPGGESRHSSAIETKCASTDDGIAPMIASHL
ncbi:hypothetical protein, partial [Burkholderia glumae]|uniref:hypothetical protein n=1 Tax=Burkholderia glumae TaxID=337 RepID=UPI001C89AC6A